MKRVLTYSILFFLLFAVLIACRKNRGESNEEEIVTTFVLTFTPDTGGTALVFQYDDPDGPGGVNPSQDQIMLSANTVYDVTVQLLNKTTNPDTDITEEIIEESDAHRFYYEPSTGSNITITNLDTDSDGVPLGVTSTWTTSSVATGIVKITLRHYPGNPPGKLISDPVNSSKSGTDVEIEFETKVE